MSRKLRESAINWMKKNPQALTLLTNEAALLMQRRYRFSIQFLVERVRWVHDIALNCDDPFKICNSYTAYISRYLLRELPGVEDWLTFKLTKEEIAQGHTTPQPLEDI